MGFGDLDLAPLFVQQMLTLSHLFRSDFFFPLNSLLIATSSMILLGDTTPSVIFNYRKVGMLTYCFCGHMPHKLVKARGDVGNLFMTIPEGSSLSS